MQYETFAEVFNIYRLRSLFETLPQFADALAEEGIIYEDSLIYKWKKGTRIPKDRSVLKAIIAVFIKHKAITNPEQANILLRAVDRSDLTLEEEAELFITN